MHPNTTQPAPAPPAFPAPSGHARPTDQDPSGHVAQPDATGHPWWSNYLPTDSNGNFGFGNTGHHNIGLFNHGDYNTGIAQSGDHNVGIAQFGGDRNIGVAQFGGSHNIGEGQFGGDHNIGVAQFGGAHNIGGTQFGGRGNHGAVQFSGARNNGLWNIGGHDQAHGLEYGVVEIPEGIAVGTGHLGHEIWTDSNHLGTAGIGHTFFGGPPEEQVDHPLPGPGQTAQQAYDQAHPVISDVKNIARGYHDDFGSMISFHPDFGPFIDHFHRDEFGAVSEVVAPLQLITGLARGGGLAAENGAAESGAQSADPRAPNKPDQAPDRPTDPATPPAPSGASHSPTNPGGGHTSNPGQPATPARDPDGALAGPRDTTPVGAPQRGRDDLGGRDPPEAGQAPHTPNEPTSPDGRAAPTEPTAPITDAPDQSAEHTGRTGSSAHQQMLNQLDSSLPAKGGQPVEQLDLTPAQRAALPEALRDNPDYTYFEDHRGNGYLRRTPTRAAHDRQLPSIPQITNELGSGAGERSAAGESENRGDPAHGNAGIDRSTKEPGNAHDVAAAATETRTPQGQVDPDALARFIQTLPSLDADGAGGLDNALTDFTNSAVGREGLTLEKLAGGGAQGISGAPVYLVRDADNNVVAITKVFPEVSELAQEMSALDKLSSDEFQRFHTPDVLGAAAVDQPSGTQGALVMSLAKGQSLDDVIKNFRTSTDKAGAWQQANTAVADSARALAELHSRSAEPGRTMTEPYMENHQRTARNAATSMAAKHADVLRSAGIDPDTLPARIDELFDAARADPGPASVVHGDSHAGNIFWAPGEQGSASGQVTFIDAGLGHFSMDQSGRAIGTAARDTAKLERWLDRYSLRGFDPDQANELRDTFVGAYRDAGGPAVSEATSQAFTARYALLSALGEADRAVRPGLSDVDRASVVKARRYELGTLRKALERH